MVADGRSGSVVTLLADSGDRYADTYLSDEWVSAQGLILWTRRGAGRIRTVMRLGLMPRWCAALRFG